MVSCEGGYALGGTLPPVPGPVLNAGWKPPNSGPGYAWAKNAAGFDLDDFLTCGGVLNARQVESLAIYLRSRTVRDQPVGDVDQLGVSKFEQ